MAVATFVLERKLPYKKMLIVTGVLLTVVLVIMVGKTVRTMQGVGWVPITPIDIDLPYWTGHLAGHLPDRRDAGRPDRRRRLRDRQLLPGRAHARATGRRATAPAPAPAGASANGASGSNGSNGAAPASQPAAEREPVGGAGKRGP